MKAIRVSLVLSAAFFAILQTASAANAPNYRIVDRIKVPDGALTSRLWTKPSIAVLAVDAPSVADVSNQIVPVARAVVSMQFH